MPWASWTSPLTNSETNTWLKQHQIVLVRLLPIHHVLNMMFYHIIWLMIVVWRFSILLLLRGPDYNSRCVFYQTIHDIKTCIVDWGGFGPFLGNFFSLAVLLVLVLVLYHRFMKDWWVFIRYPALYDQKTEKVGIVLKFGPGVNSDSCHFWTRELHLTVLIPWVS